MEIGKSVLLTLQDNLYDFLGKLLWEKTTYIVGMDSSVCTSARQKIWCVDDENLTLNHQVVLLRRLVFRDIINNYFIEL